MKPNRRALLLAGVAAWCGPLGNAAGAAPYPTKPVRLIVPFPPGQASDIFARMLAHQLSIAWGQQVLVENRGGGAGVPAMLAGKAAAADGYTLIMGTSGTLGITPLLYADPPYDPLADFAPVGGVFVAPLVIVAHPRVPLRTVPELVAAAKKAPGGLLYASPGQGTAQHMTAELLCARAGIELRRVAYKGSGPAMVDLLGGQVELMVDSVAASLPNIRAGKIRAIAVTTARRIPQLPDVPTVAEAGYPGFEGVGWAGIVVPAATPSAMVERLSADVRAALADAKLQRDMIARGGIPDPSTPTQFGAFVRSEIEKWTRVVKEAGVRLDE